MAETLFDICRTARFLGGGRDGGELRELAEQACAQAKEVVRTGNMLTAVLLVKQDLCTAVLMVDECHNVGKMNSTVPGDNGLQEQEVATSNAPPVLMTLKQAEGFALNNRLEALKLLERVLQVTQARVKDAALIQEICVEMWNAAFPLLVPHLRKKVHRSIQIIASALADIESPLCRLRAQIHYELAKCEEQSDFVVKAHLEAKRAYDLDYGELNNAPSSLTGQSKGEPSVKGGKKGEVDDVVMEEPYISRQENLGYDTDRPLDVVLSPFVETLFLRSSVYSSPEGVEDQVLMNIQQIRESSSKRYKKETLSKSAKMMFGHFDSNEDGLSLGHFMKVMQWEQDCGLQISSEQSHSLTRRGSSTSTVGKRAVGKVIPLEVIDDIVDRMGVIPDAGEEDGYTTILKLIQKRVAVMMGIAQIGHVSQAEVYRNAMNNTGYMTRNDVLYREELSYIVEKCLLFVLSYSWKPQDVMVEKLVLGQIEAACLLSESLINRMDTIDVQEEDFIAVVRSRYGIDGESNDENTDSEEDFVDPRAIGIEGKLTTSVKSRKGVLSVDEEAGTLDEVDCEGALEGKEDDKKNLQDDCIVDDVNGETKAMMNVKRMVVKLQRKALDVAVQASDIIAVQNVVTYFWNTHIHIFRKNLYHLIMPETLDFLKAAVTALSRVSKIADDTLAAAGDGGNAKGFFPVVDYRLSTVIIEALALSLEAKGEMSEALTIAQSGCSSDGKAYRKVYLRRRLCELVSRLSCQGGEGGGAKSGKGGASGGAPQFDHPLLSVFSLLNMIELYDTPPHNAQRDAIPGLIKQATQMLNTEVAAFIDDLNAKMTKEPMLLEDNSQYQEMLVESWARLTRANLKIGDVHATDAAAAQCMEVVSRGILEASQQMDAVNDPEATKGVNKRVWRWASLAERFIGIAISQLIKQDGQDKSIQNQLRLASLRHLSLSCQFGVHAEIDALVLSSAVDAWNISLLLLDDIFAPGSRLLESPVLQSLQTLQHQIIAALLSCHTEEPDNDENDGGDVSEADEDQVSLVKQQFYLALIQEYALREEWKVALSNLMEAFEQTPVRLQKPLWKWRVIVMSKLGKSVLDGIQKLKENDSSLQARVYAILARSATKTGQQLEAYRKTIEILNDDIQRVEYLLETAQWMSSTGMPQVLISETIQGAVDALYEIEEQCLEEKEEDDQKDGTMSECSRATSHSRRSSRSSKSKGGRASIMMGSRSRSGSKKSLLRKSTSVKSIKTDAPPAATRLNLKQLEQAVRCVVMLAMMQSTMEGKGEKCLEAMFFLQRSFQLWQESVSAQAQLVVQTFTEELQSAPEGSDKSGNTPTTSGLTLENVTMTLLASRIPTDPVDLISWIPSKEFQGLMMRAVEMNPLNVPSSASLQNVQLSIFYLCRLSEILDTNGYVKSALWCLAWVRLCVMYSSDIDAAEPIFAAIYFKSLSLLSRCNSMRIVRDGSEGDMIKLSSQLGSTDTSLEAFVSNFSSSLPEKSSRGTPKSLESADMASFYESFSISDAPRVMTAMTDITRADVTRPDVFTIPTWTLDMPVNTDVLSWFMDISKSLFTMGLFGRCKKIAVHVLLESKSLSNMRLGLESATLLAELDLMAGKASDVISQVVALSNLLSEAGDATMVARHAVLLIKSYALLKSMAEATDMARLALNTIEGAVIVALPNIRLPSNTKILDNNLKATQSHATLRSMGNLSAATSRTNAPTHQADKNFGSDLPTFENSYEACVAYIDVAFVFIDNVMVPEHINQIEAAARIGRVEVNENFFEAEKIANMCMQCEALAMQVDGCSSFLRASVLSNAASCLFHLYVQIHRNFSKEFFSSTSNSYKSWLDATLTELVAQKQQALDIFVGLQSRVPVVESTYASPENPSERVFLSSNTMRVVANTQVQVSEMMIMLHLYRDVFVPSPVLTGAGGKLSAIEKYLENSRPIQTKGVVTLQSLEASPVNKAIAISADAVRWFISSEQIVEANVLMATAVVAEKMDGGEAVSGLGTQWHRRRVMEEGDDEVSVLSFDPASYAADDTAAMDDLESALLVGLAVRNPSRYNCSLLLGALYLADASGKYSPAATASYLLSYQSLVARQWLFEMWRAVLNPTSEVAFSLNRIDSLLSQGVAAEAKTQKRLEAEYTFLESVSIAWQRLSVVDKPKNIVANTLLPVSAAIISLQLCPLRRTLYVSAGFPKQEASYDGSQDIDESTSDEKMPGVWCVDKIYLDEDGRKKLQTILQQHTTWVESTTKHVAAFSEGMTGGMDFEGYVETQKGHLITELEKTILKAEHALEEELRALVEALETLLGSVLGPESSIRRFFDKYATSTVTDEPYATLLLGDDCLQALPWEALSIFDVFKGHVTRDYSINVLGSRLKQCPTSSSILPLNAAGVRCIIDPFGDDDVKELLLGEVTEDCDSLDGFGTELITHGNMEQNMPRLNMQSMVNGLKEGEGSAPGGDKWVQATPPALKGAGMTTQDWISLVGGGVSDGEDEAKFDRMLFAYLPGRLVGSLISPKELVNLNCQRMALAFVADWTQTDSSYRRQQSTDSRKRAEELELESPRCAVAVLSLTGVGCVVARQWSSPPTALDKCVKSFWTGFASENKTVLQTMASFRNLQGTAIIPNDDTSHDVQDCGDENSVCAGTRTVTKPLRRWVRYAEVTYGIGNITYSV